MSTLLVLPVIIIQLGPFFIWAPQAYEALAMAENLSSFGVYIAVAVTGCSAGDKEKKVAKLEKYREQLCEHDVCAAKRSVESIFNTAQGRSVVSSGTLFAKEVVMTCLYGACPALESQLPRFAHFWFPSAHVCLGVSTGDAHTKADHTYTLLHVPPQENEEGCPIKYAVSTGTVFHFYLNDMKEGHIQIPMNQLVSVLSIAFCLKHLQTSEGNFCLALLCIARTNKFMSLAPQPSTETWNIGQRGIRWGF
jgi:hypothetical protein